MLDHWTWSWSDKPLRPRLRTWLRGHDFELVVIVYSFLLLAAGFIFGVILTLEDFAVRAYIVAVVLLIVALALVRLSLARWSK